MLFPTDYIPYNKYLPSFANCLLIIQNPFFSAELKQPIFEFVQKQHLLI